VVSSLISQECLKTLPIATELITIRSRSSVFHRQLVRKGEKMWIAAMVRDPILIERPIIAGGRAGLGRSPENVKKPAALGASRCCLPVSSACK
jgi:arsenate reductase-like glutaredoxin family protein